MPHLLYIPDTALCEAVIEQITVAKLGEAMICDTPQAILKQVESNRELILIMDGDDKKATSLISALAGNPSALLVLGGADESEHATETFSKPVRLGHFITRLRYYVETVPLLRNQIIAFGPYRVEPQNRCIFRNGYEDNIRLTEKETALLVFLGTRSAPATRREILVSVWGYDENIDTHTLETHIYQLRRKLDKEGENWLINEAGSYYLAGR